MVHKEMKKILTDIWFTEGESKVYLALLEVGESKVGPIIKSSRISRSKVYDVLERLIHKGTVSKINRNGVLLYQALPPDALLNMIREKELQIKAEEDTLKSILPQLLSLRSKQKVNVMVYDGFDGFKAMINRTVEELAKDDIYLAMGISQTTESMRHYARKIYDVQKKKLFKAKSIFDEQGAHKMRERKNRLHEMRLLPAGWNTPALFTVYRDTVGIHLGKDDSIMSVVIKNPDIAKSFQTSFEAMWKIAKKV